MIIVKGW
jgi:hypothetical protein